MDCLTKVDILSLFLSNGVEVKYPQAKIHIRKNTLIYMRTDSDKLYITNLPYIIEASNFEELI